VVITIPIRPITITITRISPRIPTIPWIVSIIGIAPATAPAIPCIVSSPTGSIGKSYRWPPPVVGSINACTKTIWIIVVVIHIGVIIVVISVTVNRVIKPANPRRIGIVIVIVVIVVCYIGIPSALGRGRGIIGIIIIGIRVGIVPIGIILVRILAIAGGVSVGRRCVVVSGLFTRTIIYIVIGRVIIGNVGGFAGTQSYGQS
jgi:hypothetical protein